MLTGRDRSLRGALVGVFGASALLVAAIFALLLASVTSLRNDDRSAQKSSDLMAEVALIERRVIDAETALRGLIITHRVSFLAPYWQALTSLPREERTLSDSARSADERRQADAIATAVRSYLSGYAEPLVRTGGFLSDARATAVTARGKQLVDALRARFARFQASELILRQRQQSEANGGASRAEAAAAIGLGLTLLTLLALGLYLLRGVLRPVGAVADAAERLAGGDYRARAPVSGRGEVATLAHSFNTMADAIHESHASLSQARIQLYEALAEAEEASQAKSNFLSNMSHEIRTPLNGVVGMLTLLSGTELTAEQREYAQTAVASGEALMAVVNDILDIAKIEAGRLEIEEHDFPLHAAVESCCDMVAAAALAKGVSLQSFVHDDVPAAVCGDRTRTAQILINLLSNAVKFTSEGEVVVEVSLGGRGGDRVEVIFEVRDTGIGIPEDRLAHLFEPFIQADAGTTRRFGGTGLGLTICRELTRLLGGTIEASSRLGQGSSFKVRLPFAPARHPLAPPRAPDGLRGLKVLVVDDHETNRRIFEAYVSSWGMSPSLAGDAASALRQLEAAASEGHPFDVALLDEHMPGATGSDLARHIAGAEQLRATRLILLSSTIGEPQAGREVFASRISKPVRQSRLLDAITAAVAGGAGTGPTGRDSRTGAADGSATSRPLAAPSPEAPAGAPRVLVAEDHPANWMLVDRLLARRGLSATNARDGRDALEQLETSEFQLVLMDCQMPVIDGYEATRELRRREVAGERPRTPVIAMTANAMRGDREACLAAGMDDYISKPISVEALDAILARWLPEAART